MNFSDTLNKKIQKRSQQDELRRKEYVSLYDILRSAKQQFDDATDVELSSTLAEHLSENPSLRFFRFNEGSITDVDSINFAIALDHDRKKSGSMTFAEAAGPHLITPASVLKGIRNTRPLSDESLRMHGFLREEIAPRLDFELLAVIEDVIDYKKEYYLLLAKSASQSRPPSLSGEIYAIKREELLTAALGIICQNQKSGKKTIVPSVTDLLDELEKQANIFWPHIKNLPMSRSEAAKILGSAMNLFEKETQDIESLREEKKRKRKALKNN